jgi:hypothetical protein
MGCRGDGVVRNKRPIGSKPTTVQVRATSAVKFDLVVLQKLEGQVSKLIPNKLPLSPNSSPSVLSPSIIETVIRMHNQ